MAVNLHFLLCPHMIIHLSAVTLDRELVFAILYLFHQFNNDGSLSAYIASPQRTHYLFSYIAVFQFTEFMTIIGTYVLESRFNPVCRWCCSYRLGQ